MSAESRHINARSDVSYTIRNEPKFRLEINVQ